jgi:hypothetical protein
MESMGRENVTQNNFLKKFKKITLLDFPDLRLLPFFSRGASLDSEGFWVFFPPISVPLQPHSGKLSNND